MARRRGAAAEKLPEREPQARLVGERATARLDSVRNNDWNPNELSPFEKQALRYGLQEDGWLPSHALTIWRTNELGEQVNIIIDGEHRWREATQMGWVEGPMVFLDGLTEAQAKALTVKLDAKRGHFNEKKLTAVLRDIAPGLKADTRSLNLGIPEDSLTEYLRDEDKGGIIGVLPSGQTAAVKMALMHLTPERHEEFQKLVKELSVRLKTKNVTDTVVEACRRAAAAPVQK